LALTTRSRSRTSPLFAVITFLAIASYPPSTSPSINAVSCRWAGERRSLRMRIFPNSSFFWLLLTLLSVDIADSLIINGLSDFSTHAMQPSHGFYDPPLPLWRPFDRFGPLFFGMDRSSLTRLSQNPVPKENFLLDPLDSLSFVYIFDLSPSSPSTYLFRAQSHRSPTFAHRQALGAALVRMSLCRLPLFPPFSFLRAPFSLL